VKGGGKGKTNGQNIEKNRFIPRAHPDTLVMHDYEHGAEYE